MNSNENNNILKFLDIYKNKSFDRVPLCEGDIILAALFSYANLENHNKCIKSDIENNVISVSEFHTERDFNLLAKTTLEPKMYEELYRKICSSKRYRHFKFGYIETIFDDSIATQFFAFSIFSKTHTVVIFRGTDTTLIGWKEDFEMASKDKIPSQILAKKYLKKISEISSKPIIIIGHSKGGNLAYYSYLASSKAVKKKIKVVYNLDGPGFNTEKFDDEMANEKLIKIVPQHSIIGMLMESTSNYVVVKSNKTNILAHDLTTWQFDNNNAYLTLLRTKKLSKYSLALQISINEWLKKYSNLDFKMMADFVYNIATSNYQTTVLGLKLDAILKRKIYLDSIKEYNKKKKDKIRVMSRDFIKMYFNTLLHIYDYDTKTLELKNKI